MPTYQIALLPGDGIGPEITQQAVNVLSAAAEKFGFTLQMQQGLIGGAAIDACSMPLPTETIDLCKQSDAVLLGAVGGPKWDHLSGNARPEAGLLGIRAALGLFANLRPALVYAPLRNASPLKDEILGDGLDLLIVRELTGGIYFGRRERLDLDGEPYAYDTESYKKSEIQRILHTAFRLAQKRSKKLCSVDKANVLASSQLWRETANEIAAEYPDVSLSHMYVDNAAMQLVRAPRQFDTMVTNNIFGDILSDEASQITGSIGMLPSASMSDSSFGLFEPIHGSAPDIAGKNIANPLASILSAAMLLRYSLDEAAAADAIDAAVSSVLSQGLRTGDIAEADVTPIGTSEMGAAVIAALKA